VSGSVREIYVARAGGAPMEPVAEIEAVAEVGLRGDRYAERTGYWSGIDECQVTLIEGEVVDQIDRETELAIEHGEHRRNIITRGVRLLELAGKRFSVGEAVLEYDRPRPPCRYIEALTEPGMMAALGGRRGGICARVIESGTIRVGDAIEVVT
jgi:MOSC domain-containing protein YiiM